MHIVVVNKSTLVSNADVQAMTRAVAIQVRLHAALAWGRAHVTVAYAATTRALTPDTTVIGVLDDSDQAGALGWHTENPGGVTFGRVFARPVLDNGGDALHKPLSVASVLSHEVIEAMVDPACNRWADDGNGKMYALETCLTGDTKIPLLDGSSVPIRDLVDREHFWVYSIRENGNVGAGRGHSARLTQKSAPVVRVWLDDGESFECTANHRIMLRDGTYQEAGRLAPGQSVMPLYRRREPISSTNRSLYEQVYDPLPDRWVFTHRAVEQRCPKGYVRHHRDFNRFNNSPDNLELLLWDDHRALHAEHADRTLHTPEALERSRQRGRERFLELNASHRGKKRPELCVPRTLTPEQRAACGERGRVALIAYNQSDEHRERAREAGRAAMLALWQREEFRQHHVDRGRQLVETFDEEKRRAGLAAFHADSSRVAAATEKRLARWTAEDSARSRRIALEHLNADPDLKRRWGQQAMHTRWHVNRGIVKAGCEWCEGVGRMNHKVLRVEDAGTADVYDLTVDSCHNFAIESGVFVHNCDAVESDSYTIPLNDVGNVTVSNFVTPAWADPDAPAGARFDWMGRCTQPFQLTKGGYVVTRTAGGEQQSFAEHVTYGSNYPAWRRDTKQSPLARTARRMRAA